jgi:hypothetical protein
LIDLELLNDKRQKETKMEFSKLIGPSTMEQHALKIVNKCLNTNFYSYLETSGACVIKLITAVIYLDSMVKP